MKHVRESEGTVGVRFWSADFTVSVALLRTSLPTGIFRGAPRSILCYKRVENAGLRNFLAFSFSPPILSFPRSPRRDDTCLRFEFSDYTSRNRAHRFDEDYRDRKFVSRDSCIFLKLSREGKSIVLFTVKL